MIYEFVADLGSALSTLKYYQSPVVMPYEVSNLWVTAGVGVLVKFPMVICQAFPLLLWIVLCLHFLGVPFSPDWSPSYPGV